MKSRKAFLGLVLVALTILIIDGNARAGTIYVPDNYSTIQLAINNATDGDTIIVRDGTYPEYIELGTLVANTKNNLTIQAENQGSATIQYTGMGPVPVVYIEGDSGGVPTGTTIDGFNLVRSTSGIGAGVLVSNSNTSTYATVTVKNCTMSGNQMRSGVRLDGYIEATITGNTITGPQRAGIVTSAPDFSSNEDYLYGNSIVTIEDNIINGNSVTNRAGIFLKGYAGNTAQVVIRGTGTGEPKASRIYGNGTAGIRLEDIYGAVTIDNNQVNNNSKAGICIIDIGSGTATATVQNNNVYDNTQAGITVAGASYLTIGTNNNIRYNGTAGVAFRKASITVLYSAPVNVSSQPVTITGNNIYSNTKAGIAVIDNVTGAITIDDNKIYQNTTAGVGIFNNCTVVITDNEIYTHTGAAGIFTGDWSGTLPPTGSGFERSNGPADLTIKRNKVHGNRAGIRVDHASGTINNNLVYGNSRGGIRFSGNNVSPYAPFSVSWGITEIKNNTVADNGGYVAEFSEDRGGGIVYDDITDTTGRNFYDHPVGATQNPITIKNNIVANNEKAGIKFCADNTADNRSYNLFYQNQKNDCAKGDSRDCARKCRSKTLGRCDAQDVNCCNQDSWADFAVVDFPGDWATGEICGQNPLFNADYTLQGGSPAIGAGSDNNDMGAYGGTDPITW